MADLNKYSSEKDKQKEDPTLGEKMTAEAKGRAKQYATKRARGAAKDGVNKLTNGEFSGLLGKAKELLKYGLKQAAAAIKSAVVKLGQAAAKGISALVEFLVSNPVGWVILVILVIIIIIVIAKFAIDKKNDEDEARFMAESFSTVMISDADCRGVKKKAEAAEETAEIDAKKKETAKKVYEVFHEYGLADEQIAGMLGNMDVESDIDPTCVEGVSGESYQMGTKKMEAFKDMNNYCKNILFPLYRNNNPPVKHKPDNYMVDGKYYCGVGIVQWTCSGCKDFIDHANGNDWYSLDYQLAYMLTDTYYRKDFLKNWKEKDVGTPEEESVYFRQKYEGNYGNGYEDSGTRKGCKTLAKEWYAVITDEWAGKSEFKEFVTTMFDMAKNLAQVAIDTATSVGKKRCADKLTGYDNSSMASAAISYAYATKAEGEGNKGTALYQKVHEAIYPGDSYYMSCDRSVACAVRWSGMDDAFPAGPTDYQLKYMKGAPDIWEHLGTTENLKMEDFQPGDIFCLNGHVWMFTGHELIESRHGKKAASDADTVSGSLGKRSPGCGNDTINIMNNNGGRDWEGRGYYDVFRCKTTTPSDKYKDVGG